MRWIFSSLNSRFTRVIFGYNHHHQSRDDDIEEEREQKTGQKTKRDIAGSPPHPRVISGQISLLVWSREIIFGYSTQ